MPRGRFTRKVVFTLALLAGGFLLTNFRLVARYSTYPHRTPATSIGWYEPKETVHGRPGAAIPSATRTSIRHEALDASLAWVEARNPSAFLVMKDGQIVVERYYGGFTAQSLSNTMSMAKGILALMVGIAIGENKIASENDPVARYLPEWADDARGRITVQDLLQMTSGLTFDDNMVNPFSDVAQLHAGVADVDRYALATRLGGVPGAAFHYTNVNAQLLSLVVERATGRRYAEYLSEKLWQPLGAGDGALWLDHEGGRPRTYCCFFATARDWLKVAGLMLDKGRADGRQIVPARWIEKMTTSSTHEPEYGYGLWLGYPSPPPRLKDWSIPSAVTDMYYFSGQGKERMYITPSKGLVIVRLGEDVPTARWDEAFLTDTLARGIDG
jgi:CubicO group peptidase (beta-lactamase class C family)